MVTVQEDEVKLMVDSWNAHHGVPMSVRVLQDDGSFLKTKTRSEAWVLASGWPLVRVEGVVGGYSLFRVAPDWE